MASKTILQDGISLSTNPNIQYNLIRPGIINYNDCICVLSTPMKYIQYKQHIAVKYVISLALICPRSISTLTALPSGYSATAYGSFLYSHIFIYVVLSFLWNYDYLMSFVFWALTEVARELCLYKFQNALIAGPAQWDMRDDNTWLV